ncbi:nuclear transport factor 2 family protein [Solitalea sp. MAHUQ-68]|uniref:Nuclear transport factor 2 family protein n=1 Tax=Solitalea agri TaxID=2953739 RepID=A0A9X2JCN9_9SPHI|nr:nuclear transport factor 2 family protein [Solitalea agri]MCO4293273.1 nuclear transport factor 2 family protein [Solitalea agri]
MKKLIFFLLALVTMQANAQKLSSSIIKSLDGAEKAMFAATANGDSSAFRKICGADYFTINANGVAMNLEDAIQFVPRFKGSSVELSEQSQRIFGEIALRTGKAKFYFNGQQVAEALYTQGWIYRDSRWQFIHWQGTFTGMSLEGQGLKEPPKN